MATPTTIGDIASGAFSRRRFTVAEYYKLADAGILTEDDRVELIEGDIVEMTPIGLRHAATVDITADILRDRLANLARVRIQNPVHLADDTEPQPDLTVCALREYFDRHPTPADIFLIVEIADSSVERDRAKILFYARAGIREVWLVDLTAATIELYRGPMENEYRTIHRIRREDSLTIEAFPGISFAADNILR